MQAIQKDTCYIDNPILEYAASANVIFSYYKVKDDIKAARVLSTTLNLVIVLPYKRPEKGPALDNMRTLSIGAGRT